MIEDMGTEETTGSGSGSQDLDAALTEARERGRSSGMASDRALRELETRDREKRLAELAWVKHRTSQDWQESGDSAQRLRLESRLDELARYVRTIESSKPWRLIQGARRLFGREW